MIFELPDIFFGSHPKKEMASQPLQVRQYGFAKNSKKPYHKRIFKKSGDIFFGATSQNKNSTLLGAVFVFFIYPSEIFDRHPAQSKAPEPL